MKDHLDWIVNRRIWLQSASALLIGTSFPACTRRRTAGEADVCVVGSGPAGTLLALDLARRGVQTLLVEGGSIQSGIPRAGENAVDLLQTGRIPYPLELTRFFGNGGTSNLWAARCPRFQPRDYESTGAEWPVRYADLEAYFDRAERGLDVRGGPGARSSPPRQLPLAVDASRDPSCLQDVLRFGGLESEVAPISYRSRVAQAHIPEFTAESSAEFLTGVRVQRLLTTPGRVEGLEVIRGGETTTLRAKTYVLACGGVETPRLLLHSRTPDFMDGIGNAAGLVGRYFTENLWIELGTAVLGSGSRCLPRDVISWDFYDEFKDRGLGGVIFEFVHRPEESSIALGAVIELSSIPENRVSLHTEYRDEFGAPSADVVVRLTERDRATAAYARQVSRRIASLLRARSFVAGEKVAWGHHHTGTCRMGSDPGSSVVDANLKVHGVENLFVAGSAPFVTSGVGSPTLLLSALSLRLADYIVARIRDEGAVR